MSIEIIYSYCIRKLNLLHYYHRVIDKYIEYVAIPNRTLLRTLMKSKKKIHLTSSEAIALQICKPQQTIGTHNNFTIPFRTMTTSVLGNTTPFPLSIKDASYHYGGRRFVTASTIMQHLSNCRRKLSFSRGSVAECS